MSDGRTAGCRRRFKSRPRWRNVVDGGTFTEIGRATQNNHGGAMLVICRGEGGTLWAFDDARFTSGDFARINGRKANAE